MLKIPMKKSVFCGGLALLLGLGSVSGQSPAEVRQQIEATNTTISEMVRVRQSLSETRRDWDIFQEIAERRINLFRTERDTLRQNIRQTEERTTEAERRIAEIRADMDMARAANRVVLDAMPALEARLRELAEYFPAPLRSRPAFDRLLSQLGRPTQASDRMQMFIGILNEADRFNSVFTLVQDERTGANGEIVLVDVLYVGLGFAYYVSQDGMSAGYGVPARGGWNWTEQANLGPSIQRAVDYYRGRLVPAEAVPLPVRVTNIQVGG